MQQSVEGLEKKQLESITANRKREREISEEEEEEEGDPLNFVLI